MRGIETVGMFTRPKMERGDWLFSCRMEPLQFGEWDADDPLFFGTVEGSWHDVQHCGLKPVSAAYAEWFLKHELWRMFEFFQNSVVQPNAMWRKEEDSHFRVAVNGVEYHHRKNRGRMRFTHLRLGSFIYVPMSRGFDLTNRHAYRSLFDLYACYIKYRCLREGIKYEGY